MEEKTGGGFLFISHSHKDLKKVRQLRNKLEEAGFEPLCFYLKCLDEGDELEDLIKREIDAREWFIYADSPSARKSEWVQKECEWRTRDESANRKLWHVDLESDISIDEISRMLIRGLRVNVIHSQKDTEFAEKLIERLRQRDLQVTSALDFEGGNIIEEIADNIEKASEYGTNIIILSRNSIDSEWAKRELYYACRLESMIVPVIIDDAQLSDELTFLLISEDVIYNRPVKTEDNLNRFIDSIVDRVWDDLNNKFGNSKESSKKGFISRIFGKK